MPIPLSPETIKKLQAWKYFQGRVEDLEGLCHQPEFTYWPPASRG